MSEELTYSQEYLDRVHEFQRDILSQLPKNGSPAEDSPVSDVKTLINYPKGFIETGVYQSPKVDRQTYIRSLQDYAFSTNYINYIEIADTNNIFLNHAETINLFHPDFVQVFNLFRKRYGEDSLYVIKGLSRPDIESPNAHTIGMAIDIKVESENQKNKIMNAAWLVGFPSILQVGGSSSDGHIHLDLCPYEPFLYDGKLYEGPWSL